MDMTVMVEMWAIGADRAGLWLLGHDAWRSRLPVQGDSDAHFEALQLLQSHGLETGDPDVPGDTGDMIDVHSTSWRQDGSGMWLTYYGATKCTGPVVEHWPDAQPIDLSTARAVGPAPVHGPLDAPAPRDVDVLLHALRHLKARLGYDSEAIAAFAGHPHYAEHLAELEPALADMYRHDQAA